ncbi:membrane protein [Cryobacterium roopkundense]|uniref:Fluoride-specific ion channel FluC n=1 Tax=Cryobacterium roopkundense TaxID=1001240 RepID=A0A099J4U3_9MICO|nr:CrcB family protein [Cryobacterium roopkundense]KGJ72527.1 membrane protein [Cryobacterium roopkundense]MBB5642626.1 CrcB protein [Cryobacterium roopkundense]
MHDTAKPVHLRWQYLLLVFAGGTAGTALREAVGLLTPSGGFPLTTMGINVTGAFLLGALLEALVRRGPDAGRRRGTRVLLGTGVLGGFTTYSALATDTSLLFADGNVGAALLYAGGTLVLGALATWLGIAASAARHRRGTSRAGGVA